MNQTVNPLKQFPFLINGGEMGDYIMNYDWSSSIIGTPEQWPLSLQTTLGNVLHSAFPMFLFWGEDLICFYNDAFRPSLGAEGKHPAVGKKGKDVWKEIWDFIGPLIHKVKTTGQPVWFEDQLVPFFRNGKIEDIYWTFSYSPAYGENGKIDGILVTCMETTRTVLDRKDIESVVHQRTEELRLTHQSLLKANLYLQQIINLFKEPLQVLVPEFDGERIVDFRYKLTNEAYAAYANTNPAALYGKKVGDIFPGYFQTSSFTNVVEVYTSGKANTWEIHYDKDGFDLYNLMSATRLGDEVVLHFTDFTQLKYLQIELTSKLEELKRSNQHLKEFTHAASHDLKEPIRKIQFFTDRLKDQLSARLEQDECLTIERIEKATLRMNALIDDLLQYSQVSQKPREAEDVHLSEIIDRVIEDLDVDIQQKEAVIKVGSLPVVKGYHRQLQQAFQNLLGNALKYRAKDLIPVIQISAKNVNGSELKGLQFKVDKEPVYHLIEVQDNGIGFEMENAERIFGMFQRLHGNAEYDGTGVGLAIVKKVMENHEGFIYAVSSPGKGARFYLGFPEYSKD